MLLDDEQSEAFRIRFIAEFSLGRFLLVDGNTSVGGFNYKKLVVAVDSCHNSFCTDDVSIDVLIQSAEFSEHLHHELLSFEGFLRFFES